MDGQTDGWTDERRERGREGEVLTLYASSLCTFLNSTPPLHAALACIVVSLFFSAPHEPLCGSLAQGQSH